MESSSETDELITMEEMLIKRGASLSDPTISKLSLGERIQSGKSILTLANLITKDEIEVIVGSSLAAAATQKKHEALLDNGVPGNAYVRMSTLAAAKRHNRTDALPESTSILIETILERALVFVDHQLCPSMRTTLFGDETKSIADLFRNNQLEFSIREPAINVYSAPHGHFGMHKDNNDMTILVPLSDPSCDFTGGGTAFWSQSYPAEGTHDPSLIMRPNPGTAMVFGGKVSHSGLHIQSGTRVLFVASFSRSSYGSERDRSSSWRLD